MPDKGERPRGQARARTLLQAGGAAAVATAMVAIALSGAETDSSSGQQGSSPQTMDAPHGVTGNHADTSSPPGRKSTISSTSVTPVLLAFPLEKAAERGDDRSGTKSVAAASYRAQVNEPHGRQEFLRPRPPAGPAADRRSPRSNPRSKRAPSDPRPAWPDAAGLGGNPSLVDMKCDELFPAHRSEFRIRNIACHRLFR